MIPTENSILSKVKKHIDIPTNFISKKWKIYDAYDTKTHNEALFTVDIYSYMERYSIVFINKSSMEKIVVRPINRNIGIILHTLYEFKDTKTYYNKKAEHHQIQYGIIHF